MRTRRPPERSRRTPGPAARAIGAALGLLLLLLLVAVASGARGRGAIDAAPRGVPVAALDYLFTLGVLLVVTAFVLLLMLRLPFTAPQRDPTGLGRLVVFMALITAFGYFAMRAGFGEEGRSMLQELLERQQERRGGEGVRDPGGGRPARFRWELAGAAAVLAAGLAAAHVLRRRARSGSLPPQLSLAEELAELLEDTVDDLRAEADARRAVIAAYARMERTLAAHGLPRRPSEAPLEYLSRALRDLSVPAAAALDLTALFERAKFSQHAVDVAMKDEAISALVTVRDDLRAAA